MRVGEGGGRGEEWRREWGSGGERDSRGERKEGVLEEMRER